MNLKIFNKNISNNTFYIFLTLTYILYRILNFFYFLNIKIKKNKSKINQTLKIFHCHIIIIIQYYNTKVKFINFN